MLTAVTGASGFLGGVLVRALLDDGREVRAIDLDRGESLAGLDVEFVKADVLDPPGLEQAFDGADSVVHLAAVISVTGDPTGLVRAVNVDGVRNAAEAAQRAGVRRMVHVSSVHAFDLEVDGVVTETSPKAAQPHSPAYDRSKAAGEEALRAVIDRGLDAVIVNPTGVIGPYDFAPSRMGKVFDALFTGGLPALIDGGFNWVDVRDVAAGAIAAEASGRTGENYLLPGHHRSIEELAATAAEVSGVPPPRFTVPMWLAQLAGPLATAMSRRTGSPLWYTTETLHALRFSPPVSGDKAAAELGHEPRAFATTVEDTHRWFAPP